MFTNIGFHKSIFYFYHLEFVWLLLQLIRAYLSSSIQNKVVWQVNWRNCMKRLSKYIWSFTRRAASAARKARIIFCLCSVLRFSNEIAPASVIYVYFTEGYIHTYILIVCNGHCIHEYIRPDSFHFIWKDDYSGRNFGQRLDDSGYLDSNKKRNRAEISGPQY